MQQEGSKLLVDVNEMLLFFDEKPCWSDKHATAIVAVLGEDLAAAALKHCLECNRARNVRIRPEPVTTGKVKGPRLDRWIEADLHYKPNVLFQTEIKNSSAHAFKGKPLKLDASPEEIAAFKEEHWQNEWDSRLWTLRHQATAKVLVRMNPPDDTKGRRLLPLLIFWRPVEPAAWLGMKPHGEGGHLFRIANPGYVFPFTAPESWSTDEPFQELWIFSVSSYLRSLRDNNIHELELPMPDAASRIRALRRLVKVLIE